MQYIFCGCGAVGSRIALDIARQNDLIVLIDDDTVGRENIPSSAYRITDVGKTKVSALAIHLHDKAQAIPHSVNRQMHRNMADFVKSERRLPGLINRDAIVVDTFDNTLSRNLTSGGYRDTIHVGITESREGIVYWDSPWNGLHLVPELSSRELSQARDSNPVCTNQLDFNTIILTSIMGAYSIMHHVATGKKQDFLVRNDGSVSLI
jgi:hypothetical protein